MEETSIDQDLFRVTQKVADRLTEAARAVLPNKEGFVLQQYQSTNLGLLAVSYSTNVLRMGVDNSDGYNRSLDVYQNDFAIPHIFTLEYRYDGLFHPQLIMALTGSIMSAKTNTTAKTETGRIEAKLNGFSTGALFGYRTELSPEFYLISRIGAGYQIATAKMDFTNLSNAPVSDGNVTGAADIQMNIPFISAGFLGGYEFTDNLALESGLSYVQYLSDRYNSQIQIQAGAVLSLN